MAQRIIESVDMEKAPLRMVLGSQALSATIERLKERIADYETQTELATSTDIKGEQLNISRFEVNSWVDELNK